MTTTQLLDYVHDKLGPQAVFDIVFNVVKSNDVDLNELSSRSDELTTIEVGETPTLTVEAPAGSRLVTADVKSIRALLDAGKPAVIRRMADGFEARVLRIDGNTIYLDRDVSDGKGKSSNHRSRHIIARTWRLVQ